MLNTFECCICLESFKDPVECTNCNNNFCKKHIPHINRCPICKKEPFSYKENIWLKREVSKINLLKCSLCNFEGEKENFFVHLIEKHKPEIINTFANKDGENNIVMNKIKTYDNYKYIGNLKNDKKEGKGISYYNNGNKYEGEFKNDKREGKGIMLYNDGDKYEGEFKDDKKDGKGIYYFNSQSWNGAIYVGDFKNDNREGKGIFYYKNGDRYEGEYNNDKRNGRGVYYYNNGDREMGDYFNGQKIGKHVKLCSNGDITYQIYNIGS